MANYNLSSEEGKKMIFNFIKDRMKEKKISQYQLAQMIEMNESTLIRNFKGDFEMSLTTYLKICGALQLRPYLIPAEMDKSEIQRMFFN